MGYLKDYITIQFGIAGLAFVFLFMSVGAMVVFYPVVLQAKGMDFSHIGIIIGAIGAAKLFSALMGVSMVTRRDRLGGYLSLFAFMATLALIAIISVDNLFWPLLIMTFLFGITHTICIPVLESYGQDFAGVYKVSYEHLRIFGSIGFMLGSMVAGYCLTQYGSSMVLPMVIMVLLCLAAIGFVLPSTARIQPSQSAEAESSRIADIFSRVRLLGETKGFWLLLFGCAVMHGGHGVYFAMAPLDWQKAGYSGSVISLFWDIAIIAEVVFFFFTFWLRRFLSISQFLFLAMCGGAVRWFLMGIAPGISLLMVLQVLHMTTFAAMHVAIMRFIEEFVPYDLRVVAQISYTTMLWGVVMTPMSILSGILYDAFSSQAYFFMVLPCVIGGAMALLALAMRRNIDAIS